MNIHRPTLTVSEAMRNWQRTVTFESEVCCRQSHEYYNSTKKCIISKPDHMVCERELAWREYVRTRDNNPDFPFDRNHEV